VSVEEAFAKVVGRQTSDEERARLYRLRDALGLRDNDAFWSIVMALEYYDSFFRAYPEKLAEETARAIENARAAFAVAAEKEAAEVERVLSERVAETSVKIARKLAERPVGLHRVTTVLAAAVAFGALCTAAGYSLAAAPRPFSVATERSRPGAEQVFALVLAMPAGWMIFALLVPVAAVGAKAGWTAATDGLAERRERILGGCLVVACVAGGVASAVLLAKVL
jgi:hypothetical protein